MILLGWIRLNPTYVTGVKIEMEIPQDVLFAARIAEKNAAAELKKELAIHLFERQVLGLGKASEMAGIPRAELMDMLAQRKIPLHYSIEDWERDKET